MDGLGCTRFGQRELSILDAFEAIHVDPFTHSQAILAGENEFCVFLRISAYLQLVCKNPLFSRCFLNCAYCAYCAGGLR